ncbi:unnamed protein product [Arctogadus glacialis]
MMKMKKASENSLPIRSPVRRPPIIIKKSHRCPGGVAPVAPLAWGPVIRQLYDVWEGAGWPAEVMEPRRLGLIKPSPRRDVVDQLLAATSGVTSSLKDGGRAAGRCA